MRWFKRKATPSPAPAPVSSEMVRNAAMPVAILRLCLIKGTFTSAEFKAEWDAVAKEFAAR